MVVNHLAGASLNVWDAPRYGIVGEIVKQAIGHITKLLVGQTKEEIKYAAKLSNPLEDFRIHSLGG